MDNIIKKKPTKKQLISEEEELQNYLGAVIFFSKKMYFNSSVISHEDLMQAGVIGLINGLRSYNPKKSKGSKKETYIISCIRREMMEEANKFYGVFKIPHPKKLTLNKFINMNDKNSSKEEIIKQLGLSEKEYGDLLMLSTKGDSSELTEAVEDDFKFDLSLETVLNELNLSDKEKELLTLKLDGHTYKYIGKRFGAHKETVRTQYLKLIKRIKEEFYDREV